MNTYKAEIENDNFEIIWADNAEEAKEEAWALEDEGHSVLGLFLVDENYNEVEAIF